MTNVVDQSAWWNPLLISVIFIWLGGTATMISLNLFEKNINLSVPINYDQT